MLFDFVVVVPVAAVDAVHKLKIEPFPEIRWIASLARKKCSKMCGDHEPKDTHAREVEKYSA